VKLPPKYEKLSVLVYVPPEVSEKLNTVNEEIEIAELANEHSDFFVVDPICRMLILDKTTAIQHPEENHLFFCSQACFDIFIKREAAASFHGHN